MVAMLRREDATQEEAVDTVLPLALDLAASGNVSAKYLHEQIDGVYAEVLAGKEEKKRLEALKVRS